MTDGKCPKCDGCGQVANTEDEEPWTVWAALPPGADAAVKMGLVKPKPCPECTKEPRPTFQEVFDKVYDAGGHVWDKPADPRKFLNEECR